MDKLEKCLFQYISENRYDALMEDGEYLLVQRRLSELEEKLCRGLTKSQRRLFSRYMDQANYLTGLEAEHVFKETLSLVRSIIGA